MFGSWSKLDPWPHPQAEKNETADLSVVGSLDWHPDFFRGLPMTCPSVCGWVGSLDWHPDPCWASPWPAYHMHLLTYPASWIWMTWICTEVDIWSIMPLHMFLQEHRLLQKNWSAVVALDWGGDPCISCSSAPQLHLLTLAASCVRIFSSSQVTTEREGPWWTFQDIDDAAEHHQPNKAAAMHESQIVPWEIIYLKRLRQMSTCCLVFNSWEECVSKNDPCIRFNSIETGWGTQDYQRYTRQWVWLNWLCLFLPAVVLQSAGPIHWPVIAAADVNDLNSWEKSDSFWLRQY